MFWGALLYPSLMRPVAAGAVSGLVGLLSAVLVSAGALVTAEALCHATGSGVFGICGPYGDGWSINLQLALYACAVFGSPIVGFLIARSAFRKTRRQAAVT